MQAASISTPDISGDISRPVVGGIYADVAAPSLVVDASSCPDRLTYPNMDVRLSVPDTRSDSVHARVPAPAIPVVDLKAPKKSLFGKFLKKKSSKVNFGNMDVRLSVPDTRSDSVHARVPVPAIPVVDLKAPKKGLFGKFLKKKSSKVNFGSHDVGQSACGKASGDATMHNKSLPGQLSVNNPYKPNVQAPDTRSSDDAPTRNNGSVDQDIIKNPYKPNVEASDMTSNDAAMHKKGVVGQIVDKESSKGDVEGPDMPPSVSVNKSGSAPVTRSVGVGTRKKGMFGTFLVKKPSKG